MGKDSGRGNERLDAKATDVYHVAEGEEGGSKINPESPARKATNLRRQILKYGDTARGNSYFYYTSNNPQKRVRNPRILEFRGMNMNENSCQNSHPPRFHALSYRGLPERSAIYEFGELDQRRGNSLLRRGVRRGSKGFFRVGRIR